MVKDKVKTFRDTFIAACQRLLVHNNLHQEKYTRGSDWTLLMLYQFEINSAVTRVNVG